MYNYFLHARTFLIIRRKQWIDALSTKKNYLYTPFVILCAPRTGSTLLHTYLNYHPNIKSYGEVLREEFENGNASMANYDPIKKVVFKSYSSRLKAIGLKLFYEHYTGESHFAKPFREIVGRRDIKIIHLVRRDILRLYVSLKIAESTNVWSSGKPSTETYTRQIKVDVKDFLQFRNSYLQHQQLFKTLFQEHSILEISYENLTSKAAETLELIQQFLCVDVQQVKTLLQKQNQDSVEKYIINYDSIRSLIQ